MGNWKQKATRSEGKQWDLAPEGANQPAVCVGLIDLGTQFHEYKGVGSWRHMIYLLWELVEAPGRPVVGKDFNFTLNTNTAGTPSLLRQYINNWGKKINDGDEFEIDQLVGKQCLLTIAHKPSKTSDRHFAEVAGLSAAVVGNKKLELPKPEHELILWSLEDGKESSLPDWIPWLYGRSVVEWIQDCKERTGAKGRHTDRDADPGVNEEDGGQDIPF